MKCTKATGADGIAIREGNRVQIYNPYTKRWLKRTCKVEGMYTQGANGTILVLKTAPLPMYPHHKTIQAKYTRLASEA